MVGLDVARRVAETSRVCADPVAGASTTESALVAVREIAAWTDAQQAVLVSKLASPVPFPEATIADAAKVSICAAARTRERSETLAVTPK